MALEQTRDTFIQGASILASQRPISEFARARPLPKSLEVVVRKWGLSASPEQYAYESHFLNEASPDVAVSPGKLLTAVAAVAERGMTPDSQAVLHSTGFVSHRRLHSRPSSAVASTESLTPRRFASSNASSPAPSVPTPQIIARTQSVDAASYSLPLASNVDLTPQQLAAHWEQARRAVAADPSYSMPQDESDPIAALARDVPASDSVSDTLIAMWRTLIDNPLRTERLRRRICFYAGVSPAEGHDIMRQIHEIIVGLASRTLNVERLEWATRHKEEDGLIAALQDCSEPSMWTQDIEIAWRDLLRLVSK